ncbi:MAG: Trm112 family protein [Acidobacteriota bacterium]|nr:Trm112 family protein [Acidobacteriota bacterium]
MPLEERVLEILVCPKCRGKLEHVVEGEAESLLCRACGLRYEVDDGIPILLLDEAKPI